MKKFNVVIRQTMTVDGKTYFRNDIAVVNTLGSNILKGFKVDKIVIFETKKEAIQFATDENILALENDRYLRGPGEENISNEQLLRQASKFECYGIWNM